jgi:subtilisin family serine protease
MEWTARGWEFRDLAGTTLCDGVQLRGPVLLDGTHELELSAGGVRLRVEAEAAPAEVFSAAAGGRQAALPAMAQETRRWNRRQRVVTAAAALVLLGAITAAVVWTQRVPQPASGGTLPPPAPEPSLPGRRPIMPDAPGTEGGETRRLIVKWKPGAGAEQVAAMRTSFSARTFSTLTKIGKGRMEVLVIPAGQSAEAAVRKLLESGLVEFAEVDQKMRAFVHPNDPGYQKGAQWGLLNRAGSAERMSARRSAPAARAWMLPKEKPVVERLPRASAAMAASAPPGSAEGVDIHASGGWNVQTSARRIIVAVVDTGVRYTHEDLAANMWRNPGEIPGNSIDDDKNGVVDDVFGFNAVAGNGDPMDDGGHGTHCAGIIGAVGNNSAGISGVAWQVQIMACKFLGAGGGGDISNALLCMDYAAQMGADIISASWGSNREASEAMLSVIRNLDEAGILFVAAAGNEGFDIDEELCSPGGIDLPNVVTVGSIDPDGQPSDFSNYGIEKVHLFAPGGEILSTYFHDDTSYTRLSGTSMATPFVSGALALLKTQAPYQERPAELVRRLMKSLRPLPALEGKCKTGGLLDLQSLLESNASAVPPGQ